MLPLLLVLDWFFLLGATYPLVRAVGGIAALSERLALTLLFALGGKSLVLYALMQMNVPPSLGAQTLASAIFCAVTGAACWRRRQDAECAPLDAVAAPAPVFSPYLIGMLAILLPLLALSFFNAWFFPITESDGAMYTVKARAYLRDNSFDNAFFHPEYPPLIPLIFRYLLALDWQRLKMIFPLFYLSLMIIVYHRIHANTGRCDIAAAFTTLFGATPFLWWHSILPFLNLAAAAYFSAGALYWHFLAKALGAEKPAADEGPGLAILCGSLFGFSCWTRLEFVVYCAIPLLGLMVLLNENEIIGEKLKRRLFVCFAVSFLALPTLWLVTVQFFRVPMEKNTVKVLVFTAGLWLAALAHWRGLTRIRRPLYPWIAGAGALVYFVLLAVAGPKEIGFGQNTVIGFLRTVFFPVFFSFSIALLPLLILTKPRTWPSAEKRMGLFLLFCLALHFMVFAMSKPKWLNISDYTEVFFLHPGNFVNSSGTREMLAFFPAFVFLAASLPATRGVFVEGKNAGWRAVIALLVIMNLATLAKFFVYPRMLFIRDNWHLTHKELTMTRGSPDMPNMFTETYKIVWQIKDLTAETADLYLPIRNPDMLFYDIATLQALYPRKPIWGWPRVKDYRAQLAAARRKPNSYLVFHPGWNEDFCAGRPQVVFNVSSFRMCRLDGD